MYTNQLEAKIGDLFKNAPDMPESSKKSLVNAWPWIALIFGVLQLVAAWGLWTLVTATSRLLSEVSIYSVRSVGYTAMDKTVIYLALIVLVVDAVILLRAYPELKLRSKKGWDLLFLGSLLNLGYAVVSLFTNTRSFSSFVYSLIGSAIGFYLLFQVKDKYKTK